MEWYQYLYLLSILVIPFGYWIIKSIIELKEANIMLQREINLKLNRAEVVELIDIKQKLTDTVYNLLKEDLDRLEAKVDKLLEKK